MYTNLRKFEKELPSEAQILVVINYIEMNLVQHPRLATRYHLFLVSMTDKTYQPNWYTSFLESSRSRLQN